MTIATSSSAALGLAVPVEQLLHTGAFMGSAKSWLPLAAVVFICAFLITARR